MDNRTGGPTGLTQLERVAEAGGLRVHLHQQNDRRTNVPPLRKGGLGGVGCVIMEKTMPQYSGSKSVLGHRSLMTRSFFTICHCSLLQRQ